MDAKQLEDGNQVWPWQGVSRIPYGVYSDRSLYEAERERIFRGRTWNYLALEPELPDPGDFKSTFVGDVPVVVTRDDSGGLNAFVNRCAHRGATVCRELRGNRRALTCVYHQWSYDLKGNLRGVPFQKGMRGKGGMPSDFDPTAHGLEKLRVESYHGMVFGTLSANTEPLAEYLGPPMCENIRRVLDRPIRILGDTRQMMAGNWKLYAENTRDSYHGGLLHLFYPTFNIYRPAQSSSAVMDERRWHNLFTIHQASEETDVSEYQKPGMRRVDTQSKLEDPKVIDFRKDRNDTISLSIQSLFPGVVLQQILNALAVRHLLPKGPTEAELVWTFFGYVDDDDEMTRHRLRHINLVGPAGYISMEDGEAVEICQKGTVGSEGCSSLVRMGGDQAEDLERLGLDENSIRGFWKGYREIMGL